MIFVVGSGPAGVSAAWALINAGRSVTLIDAGFRLEAERQRHIATMRETEKRDWTQFQVAALKYNMGKDRVPLKLAYGSDFPYRSAQRHLPMTTNNANTAASLAEGGFSNVWGAAVLPYCEHDISDWPLSIADLAPHYQAVLKFMDLAAVDDRLAALLPLYKSPVYSLTPSSQAQHFLADLDRNHEALEARGLYFGRSRLAVRTLVSDQKYGCVYCGLCLYGCPLAAIYNSASTLQKLCQSPRFHYLDDLIVRRVDETRGQVVLSAVSTTDERRVTLSGSRIYLAAGPLSTTRILLRSMGAYNQPLYLQDSQYFVFPFMRYRGVKNVTEEELHTLSQAFIEVRDPQISPWTVHLQAYTYSDTLAQSVLNAFGPMRGLFKASMRPLLRRLMVFQGYLHSRQSNRMRVWLRREHRDEEPTLHCDAETTVAVDQPIRALLRKLYRLRRHLHGIPLSPLLQITEPGRGFHSGGTFPMRSSPSEFEADSLGRPAGFNRVHAVDSTVFPTIPATTITLTIMANAHRIASAVNDI